MSKLRSSVTAVAMALLATGCADDDLRFRQGAGAALNDGRMASRTADLGAYFGFLCDAAGVPGVRAGAAGQGPRCPGSLSGAEWSRVTRAGFNDIDARCDAYIAWLDDKQHQRPLVNTGIGAVTALVSGVLGATGAADALIYVGLALGFGSTMYNAYNDSLLLGLEMSTIKTIVHERRRAYRSEFRDAPIADAPDSVYALQGYLRICTPATITMDVNTFTRGSIMGNAPSIAAQTRQEREGLYTPPSAEDRADTAPVRGDVTTPDRVSQALIGPGWTEGNLRTLQRAFCIPEDQLGNVGPKTRANLRLFTQGTEARFEGEEIRVNATQYNDLVGTLTGCDTDRFANVYENQRFSDRGDAVDATELFNAMRALFPGDDAIAGATGFGAAGDRALIGRARAACGLSNQGAFRNQVTPDLELRLGRGACQGDS